jgi:hypothetical protein
VSSHNCLYAAGLAAAEQGPTLQRRPCALTPSRPQHSVPYVLYQLTLCQQL